MADGWMDRSCAVVRAFVSRQAVSPFQAICVRDTLPNRPARFWFSKCPDLIGDSWEPPQNARWFAGSRDTNVPRCDRVTRGGETLAERRGHPYSETTSDRHLVGDSFPACGTGLLHTPISGARTDLQFWPGLCLDPEPMEAPRRVRFWLEAHGVLRVDFFSDRLECVLQSSLFQET